LKAVKSAWLEVAAELSAKDALFKTVADSYFTCRKNFKRWGEAPYLKATCQ
jgi:TRAP-type mannitol/chloroaromatic compound transport system substrate-binding protein